MERIHARKRDQLCQNRAILRGPVWQLQLLQKGVLPLLLDDEFGPSPF